MIKSIQLGNRLFPINLIQGPLAGYSNAPFRLLTWQYSQPAFSCTEMLSSKALIHQPKLLQRRYLQKDPNEGPVCFQLAGNDPQELATAAKIVADCGADLIDLNCGCPVKKIRRKGFGSSLLTEPTKLEQLIRALKNATSVPVSVKIRVDGNSNEKFNLAIANIINDAGADFLVVHGRHWTENYETPCHYEQIQVFVEQLNVPVIGNGDVACLASLQAMFATGCAGVMIARSGVGQPWLIRKLIAEMRQQPFSMPTIAAIGQMYLKHVIGLIELLDNEKFAVIQARKLAKYYARGLSHKIELINAVNHCNSLEQLIAVSDRYFCQ